MNRRHILVAGAVVLFIAVLLISRWQPHRQVRLHTEAILAAAGKRDFQKIDSLIAPDYSDSWGHDKAKAMEGARMILQQFLFAEAHTDEILAVEENGVGTARTRVTLKGTGSPLAQEAISRLDALQTPFAFTWRQRSWKPWDWELIAFEHPDLEIPSW